MTIPSNLLQNKKILLGVTGSIAVYKSLELTRLFIKAGAQVKVVMSESAKKFVMPLTFETLTSNQVLDDTNESWVNDHNHIKAGEWADLFVIAPATANTIAKLANAIADNMLLQCALAFPKKKILAPSANTNMLQNPITQENIQKLLSAHYEFVGTQVKELACKTTGDGAMAEPINIFFSAAKALLQESYWKDRNVIVSGGGTVEKLDDVRYLSNFSSGKMASALATALYLKGANVNFISSRYDSPLPSDVTKFEVQSSTQMLQALSEQIKNTTQQTIKDKKPYLFMAAAVSDYVPKTFENGKLKKDKLGETWELKLKKNIDILDSLEKENIYTLGFKAEMDKLNAIDNASKMLKNKNLDAVCLNILEDSSSFGTSTNKIDFITKQEIKSIPQNDKLSVSFEILNHAKSI